MLNRIKHYFTLDCVIFTIMTVVLSIVFYFTTWDNTVNKITTEEFFKSLEQWYSATLQLQLLCHFCL